jgi:hypothetical protein
LPCTSCGFDPSAGIVRRHTPEQTRGLTAVALKFGPRWSFGAAALMIGASLMYFNDITAAEETGGSFSADPFTGMIYDAAGKWAVVGFDVIFAVIFVAAGFRALSLKRSNESE